MEEKVAAKPVLRQVFATVQEAALSLPENHKAVVRRQPDRQGQVIGFVLHGQPIPESSHSADEILRGLMSGALWCDKEAMIISSER